MIASEDLVLDHYLEVLTRKPGALAGATALTAARAGGTFTLEHQRFWDAARKSLGDTAGTRALIGVLLLHRSLPASALTRALTVAATAGQFNPDLVAVTARRIIAADAATPSPILLPENATGAVSGYRPTPSLAGYDQLLNGVSA